MCTKTRKTPSTGCWPWPGSTCWSSSWVTSTASPTRWSALPSRQPAPCPASPTPTPTLPHHTAPQDLQMKIALVSGSRSDRNALVMTEKALLVANNDVRWIDVGDEYASSRPSDACISADYASETVRLSLGDHGDDLAIVPGDRHEILGATAAAKIMGVPIALI